MSLIGYLAKRGIILGNDDEVLITANLFKSQGAPVAETDGVTLTPAEILNGLIVGTPTAAAAYTLPLGTDMDDEITSLLPIGASYDFSIINLAGTDGWNITLTANTGITIVGNAIVHSNEWEVSYYRNTGIFRIRKKAADTFVVYRIG